MVSGAEPSELKICSPKEEERQDPELSGRETAIKKKPNMTIYAHRFRLIVSSSCDESHLRNIRGKGPESFPRETSAALRNTVSEGGLDFDPALARTRSCRQS